MKLFLDDQRTPLQCVGYMFNRIGADNLLYAEEWRVVRTFSAFKEAITSKAGEITHVSFDFDIHDTDEYGNPVTGLDCAKWMKDHYERSGIMLPTVFVHSNNDKGVNSILNLFQNV